jgi:tripartite-type tricarboxylate transporter receptor subunit TctC
MKQLTHPNPADGLSTSERRRFLRTMGVVSTASLVGMRISHAQTLPETIRIVSPFPAGNPPEASIRALVQALAQTSGRNYIVENKPGAGGVLATSEVAKAKPDGSTLLQVTGGHTSTAVLYSKLPYDSINDFTAITQLVTAPGYALLVRSGSPYRTVQDLVKAAQAKPNTIGYASNGNGSAPHLIGALFGRAAGAEFVHVPYKNSPMPDLIGGHVDMTFLGTTVSRPLVASGQVRMLATTTSSRLPEAPEVPTFAELGWSGVDVAGWVGILAPKGVPADLANRLHREIVAATQHPSFVAYIKSAGNDVVTTTPAQFSAYLKSEVERYQKMLPPLGIKMD